MPTPAPPRALRAALAAAVAVGVAALAHRVGHGTVDPAGMAWTFAALTGPAWWLARRERSWGALALSQLAGQHIAHVVLAGSAGHAASHGSALPLDLMLYAHLVAATLTGLWLRLGERRAWAAARRVRHAVVGGLVHLLDSGPAPAAAPAPHRIPPPVVGPPALLLRHTLARRGPPLPA